MKAGQGTWCRGHSWYLEKFSQQLPGVDLVILLQLFVIQLSGISMRSALIFSCTLYGLGRAITICSIQDKFV
jgi:hypothetical protein